MRPTLTRRAAPKDPTQATTPTPAPATRAGSERLGLILIVVSAVSFGGVAVLTKLVLATGLDVLPLSFWRWAIALATLAPVMLALRLRMTRRAAVAAFGLGVLGQAGTSGVYTASLALIPATLASFLLFLSPVFVAALAAVLPPGERLTRRGLLALASAMAGLALMALAPGLALHPLGVCLALAAALLYAGTILAARRLTSDAAPLGVAVWLMAGAVAAFGVSSAATGTWAWPAPEAWGLLVLLGVGSTALSIGTFYLALPRIGAPRAALLSTLEPVATAVVAFAVLGEVLTPVQAVGAVLILAGAALLAGDARGRAGAGEGRARLDRRR